MRQFFSTILSQAYSQKKLLLGGLAIALFFSLVPLQIAHAGFFDGLINVIIKGAAGLVDALVAPITLLVKFIAGLIGDVMYEAVKFFTNIPIVPPKAPDAIANGWNFTRSLVNIIFILILAFIGLATILRLQTYQLQKTLPSLIIIALLVNFSTVLVGFVVDIGNIFTNAFLGEAAGADWKNIGSFSFSGNPAANLATHVAEIFYYLFAILIYFVIILLFAVRTVILWVLTILSPIAFGAFVLPGTKKYWSQWLQQLIQWSILGIPISFSLLLAKGVLTSANLGTKLGLADGSAPAALMAPFTALVILFVGITLSMQMAPAGAQGVIDMGKKWGAKGALAAGSGLWRREIRGKTVGERFEKAGKWFQERGKAMEIAPQNASLLRRTLAAGAKFSGGGLVTRWAGRNIEIGSRQIRMRVGDKDTREQKAAMAEVGDRDSFDIFSLVNEELNSLALKGRPTNWNRITGLLNGVRARGDGDDIEDAFTKEDAPIKLDKKVLGKAVKVGQRIGPPGFRPLMKSFMGQIMLHPEEYGFDATRNEITGEFEGRDADFLNAQQKSLPSKFNPQDLQGDTTSPTNFNVDTPEGEFFVQTLMKERPDLYSQMIKRARKEEKTKLLRYTFGKPVVGATTVAEGKALGEEWILENAPDIYRYITSPGARSEGLGTDLEPGQANRKVREYQERQQVGPLRTDVELNAEIAKRSARIAGIPGIILNLQNQLAKANVQKHRGLLQQIAGLTEEERQLTTEVTNLTKELGSTTKERNVLNDAVNSRYPTPPGAPPKTRAEVAQEVKTEYERKYRAPLLNQLRQEGSSFIQWLADSSAGTAKPMNYEQAEQERIRQLYERFRLRDTLPEITPAPSPGETELFTRIAMSSAGLPKVGDKQRERKLTGALNKGLLAIGGVERKINRLSREISDIEDKGGNASTQKGVRDKWHTQLNNLKTRMEDMKVELAKTP